MYYSEEEINETLDEEGTPSNLSSKTDKSPGLFTILYYLFLDVTLYTIVVPFLGTYLGGSCAKCFGLTPIPEILLAVAFTFILLYAIIWFVFYEYHFWKHLLALEEFYRNLLQIRDVVNVFLLLLTLNFLLTTIELMILDKSMKVIQNLSDGVGYMSLKVFFSSLNINLELLGALEVGPPGIQNKEEYEHGAAYILQWAMLTACIAKLLYFNTLFTMSRSMEIFVTLGPLFEYDGDDDDPNFVDYESVDFSAFDATPVDRRPEKFKGLENKFALAAQHNT